ncbi:MAG TPA: sulfurtransferase [Gammaproteobacteria bacterium]|nr:sulfurtransferase [Gammaproteobacteria bacterium]
MQHISPKQLAIRLEGDESLTLLDVREPWEFEICHIDGSILIPMADIPNQLERLEKKQPLVVICHHGRRSFEIAAFLEHNGFKNLINLTGGVDAWAMEVDLDMVKY